MAREAASYSHVCIIFGHIEADTKEFTVNITRKYCYYLISLKEMYNKIETDDEGDVSMKKVVEHINAVEAGRGNNTWVSREYFTLLILSFESRLYRG